MRLGPQPGEVIDRDRPLTFTWNGREHSAFEGDTIASALAASGVRVFSRSLKYHRPRGLMTADAHDPGCIVTVDGEPNVPGGQRRITPGAAVTAQGVWPSLRFDVKAVNRLVGPALSAGFYYKTFMRPRRLWPLYERVLRRFSPGGRVPPVPPAGRYEHLHVHPDIVVAGGGPAGMAAALGAVSAGARVLLVDDQPQLGGHLRWGASAELAALQQLRSDVQAAEGVEVLTDSVVTGRYEDGLVAVVQRDSPEGTERLIKARPAQLIVAPGLIERPYVIRGNDLPGVVLSTAVRRLINLYAVKPGKRAVVFTANDDGIAAATDLERVGVDVRRVVDAREGGDVVRVRGRNRVRAAECGDGQVANCDLVVMATGWTAPVGLIAMAGGRASYHPSAARYVPAAEPDGVLATGGVVGDGCLDDLIAHGEAVGQEAARRALGAAQSVAVPALEPAPHPALYSGRTDGIVDFAEDVSAKDLRAAVEEGYDSMELVKRYTTVTMGPTQGKLEGVNAAAIVAAVSGCRIDEVGTTTARPPITPVSIGVLAGRHYQPVRRSPMHNWHVAHGATPLVAGEWIRPEHYGDPAGEVRAVRRGVGIVDVTPLGKFELRGPDVPKLLELLYVNRWQALAVGRVRYGVMCTDDGVVFDDGVTARLGDDRYLLTATSSGATAVGEWIERWLQTERPDWKVHAIAMTDAYASINVAGPRSRELLGRLTTGVDLAPEAFPYMRVRLGEVAGVAGCVVWRIGFTGELSYELHVPAGHGLRVWEALLAAGDNLGVRPFGIEAQRILRLEKGHLIVGQDTDGLTQAYSAGLGWAIKMDKDDFVGKPELAWQRVRDGHLMLVGLQPVDPSIVPPESSQIVEGGAAGPRGRAAAGRGRIVGRVTSSRYSPTLDRSICLGFVAPDRAEPGTLVTVLLPTGRRVSARVMPQLAHVDPEGERLRV
ncbi:2Fe-2S iron-sulfur cluster-binding protein [Phytoactinopolyspora mesophila]|uniref:FAD-dependent oxidoreductase n=1 Tax=Phytoactinopolyspora mesophila TaxID=2650750 RepID=A0A7K3M2H0_9ACTN|nr:2Fe-2S iron-sulfur cluster-binding protein [Phytoactinopolyspora mesophila]NDL57227.1 FAD-dependent oxidoreductase [Phytoactinopolyspora mesophila]